MDILSACFGPGVIMSSDDLRLQVDAVIAGNGWTLVLMANWFDGDDLGSTVLYYPVDLAEDVPGRWSLITSDGVLHFEVATEETAEPDELVLVSRYNSRRAIPSVRDRVGRAMGGLRDFLPLVDFEAYTAAVAGVSVASVPVVGVRPVLFIPVNNENGRVDVVAVDASGAASAVGVDYAESLADSYMQDLVAFPENPIDVNDALRGLSGRSPCVNMMVVDPYIENREGALEVLAQEALTK